MWTLGMKRMREIIIKNPAKFNRKCKKNCLFSQASFHKFVNKTFKAIYGQGKLTE